MQFELVDGTGLLHAFHGPQCGTRERVNVGAEQPAQLCIDFFHRVPGFEAGHIQAFDGQAHVALAPPVVGKLPQQQKTGIWMQVQPVPVVLGWAFGAEDDFKAAIRLQRQRINVVVVVAGAWRQAHAQHDLTRGETHHRGRPSLTRHPVDALPCHRRVVVHRVRVGLQHEHRVFERHPVRVLRRGLAVHEVALRNVHGQLTAQFSLDQRVIWRPGLGNQFASRLEQIHIFVPAVHQHS